MHLTQRDFYLEKLIRVKGTPDIKVITGIRRCGKSRLLESFAHYIAQNEVNSNIINIDLTNLQYEDLREYHALHNYIETNYAPDKRNYLFIDEVQLCSGFEVAISSLHSQGKYDIYITGSNAFLLSSDLATLFTGRTFEIEVYPFSLKEFMDYYGLVSPQEALTRYLKEGGMPGSYVYNHIDDKYSYIKDVFQTLIVRDIVERYDLRNTVLMNRLSDFMVDNISNLSSMRSIAGTITNSIEKTNHKTVGTYMDYLCNAFAFYKVKRYDIKGKRYISTEEKYYLADHSIKYATLGIKNLDTGATLENIVAIDLLRRGYEIYVGTLQGKEVDFVAINRDEKLYIQVCDNITEETTLTRELSPLQAIRDAYPKYIIARTNHEHYTIEGIHVYDVADWLVR